MCSCGRSRTDGSFLLRLNEGHTVYLERMIGRRLEGENFRHFKALGGWKDLQESVRAAAPAARLRLLALPHRCPAAPPPR